MPKKKKSKIEGKKLSAQALAARRKLEIANKKLQIANKKLELALSDVNKHITTLESDWYFSG
jgi:hypothetical protein